MPGFRPSRYRNVSQRGHTGPIRLRIPLRSRADRGGGADEPELNVQTHAWLEVFMPGLGWWGVDPTNAQPVGELHVKIGHGQDYQDVMPLRGVYHGGADHQLGVQVRISRERLSQMAEQ